MVLPTLSVVRGLIVARDLAREGYSHIRCDVCRPVNVQ
jgi:hypothetical protein